MNYDKIQLFNQYQNIILLSKLYSDMAQNAQSNDETNSHVHFIFVSIFIFFAGNQFFKFFSTQPMPNRNMSVLNMNEIKYILISTIALPHRNL